MRWYQSEMPDSRMLMLAASASMLMYHYKNNNTVQDKFKKSTKPLESKMRQISLEINRSRSNRLRDSDHSTALQY
jgi:hypothetical protein